MLRLSEQIKQAFQENSREIDIKVTLKGKTYTRENIKEMKYTIGALGGDKFQIGTSQAATVNIVFSEIIENLQELNQLKVYIGIKMNNRFEYVPLGVFFINGRVDPDRNNDKTTVEAIDGFIYLEREYKSKLTYPTRLQNMALEIANLSGAKIDKTSFNRLSNYQISTRPEGLTFRQAIGLVAQYEAGFACFDREGNLTIKKLTRSEYTITPEQYFVNGLKKSELQYQFKGITCKVPRRGNSGGETTLSFGLSSGGQVEITNSTMNSQLLEEIYHKLENLTYYPMQLSFRGNPLLEVGDWVTVVDRLGKEFFSPILDYSIVFDGGITSTISANTKAYAPAIEPFKGPLQQAVKQLLGWQSATGGWTFNTAEEPENPAEGDYWYKPDGPDVIMMKFENGKWVEKTSTAENKKIKNKIEEHKVELETTKRKIQENLDKAAENERKANFAKDLSERAKQDAATAQANANQAKERLSQALAESQKAMQKAEGLKVDVDHVKNEVRLKATQEDINNAIDGLEIGTRNLYLDTGTKQVTTAPLDLPYNLVSMDRMLDILNNEKGISIGYYVDIKNARKTSRNINRVIFELAAEDLAGKTHYIGFQKKFTEGESFKGIVTGTYVKPKNVNFVKIVKQGMLHFQTTSSEVVGKEVIVVEGNKPPLTWLPAPEDNNETITRLSTELNIQADKIEQKANKEEVDTLKQQVRQTETAFTTQAGLISGKVSQSDFDKAKNTINQLSTDFAVEAGKITTALTKIDEHTTKINRVESTFDGFSRTITEIKNQEIGTRNLILKSEEVLGFFNSNNAKIYPLQKGKDDFGQWYSGKNAAGTAFTINSYNSITYPNKKYLSEALDATNGKLTQFAEFYCEYPLKVKMSAFGSSKEVTLTPRMWTKISLTFNRTAFNRVVGFVVPENSSVPLETKIYIRNIGMVKSDKAPSDWTPAPEDTALAISTFEQKLDGFKMEVADKYANKSTVTQLSNQWQQTTELANGFESSIASLGNQLSQTVKKGNLISQINLSPEKITISGKKIHITGETHIDNAIITSAMIRDLDADKIKVGTLNGTNVNIINVNANNITTGYLNADRIRARTITADKLSANALQVGFNSMGSTIRISPTDLAFYDTNGYLSQKITGRQIEFYSKYYNGKKVADIGSIPYNLSTGRSINGLSISLKANDAFFSIAKPDNSFAVSWTPTKDIGGSKNNVGWNFRDQINYWGAGQTICLGTTWLGKIKNLPGLMTDDTKIGLGFADGTIWFWQKDGKYISLASILKNLGV